MQMPARIVIFQARMRGDVDAFFAAIEWERKRMAAVWNCVMPWLAGAAFVLAYLLICSYLDRQELAAENSRAAVATIALRHDKAELEERLAELVSSRQQKLIYLIEASSTAEAKDKLARLALMVATEHYNLQEATREPKK